jgi:hypothetical protein
MPRFLPEIRPTEFNYPIAIYGKWHGNKYRFITRFRSNHPNSIRPEFEAPFARLDYVGRDRFGLPSSAWRPGRSVRRAAVSRPWHPGCAEWR